MIEAGERVTVWIDTGKGDPTRRTGKTIVDRWADNAKDSIEIVNSSGLPIIIPGDRIILVEEEVERNYDAL